MVKQYKNICYIMELQFESNFCIQFNKVVDIKYLADDNDDDVIYHYV